MAEGSGQSGVEKPQPVNPVSQMKESLSALRRDIHGPLSLDDISDLPDGEFKEDRKRQREVILRTYKIGCLSSAYSAKQDALKQRLTVPEDLDGSLALAIDEAAMEDSYFLRGIERAVQIHPISQDLLKEVFKRRAEIAKQESKS